MIRPLTPEQPLGIVVAGHGSRDPEGVDEFNQLMKLLVDLSPGHPVTHGFLEFTQPTIGEAARENLRRGSRQVAIVPSVLLAATHAKNDLPVEVLALRREFPEAEFFYGAPLHFHPLILKLCRERIIEAETAPGPLTRRSDSCLVVVGRGTTDPDANSDVNKLARILEEGLGFGGSFVCYSGTAKPSLAEGLATATRLGFSRVVVLPFFLFTGILVKRIQQATADAQQAYPRIHFAAARHLGVHPHVAEALLERAREAVSGPAAMNCSLCKYRIQVVGYEKEVGAPQEGHHFQVRAKPSSEPALPAPKPEIPQLPRRPYQPHPIEAQSFAVIEQGHDWEEHPPVVRAILQRLVHTSGDFAAIQDVFVSGGAEESGLRALLRGTTVLTDVTMVQTGLRRPLLEQLGVATFCAVHDEETHILARTTGLTRSAAGIRRGWEKLGNNVIVAIGDAPTAVEEVLRLVREQKWSPHLVVGLPVGFIGTRECKESLRRCLQIQRITNRGTRGGSPWAAAVINALLICAVNRRAELVHPALVLGKA